MAKGNKKIKKERRQLILGLIIQVLGFIVTFAIIAGFAFSLFGLMGAASTAGILRYGFATVAFSIMLPGIVVNYRRKS